MSFDKRVLRDALGLFVTGVTVITTKGIDGKPTGLTANSFNSVSLDPPLVLWSIGAHSKSLPAFAAANHFAVHILGENQIELSQRFAQSGIDKFASLPITEGIGDVPLLEGCAARLECSIYDRHAAGDHVIYLGEVQRLVHNQNARPLVYHGGQYAELADKWPEPTNS